MDPSRYQQTPLSLKHVACWIAIAAALFLAGTALAQTAPAPVALLCGTVSWNDESASSVAAGDMKVALTDAAGNTLAVAEATALNGVPEPCRSRLHAPQAPPQNQTVGYFGFVSEQVNDGGSQVRTLQVPGDSRVTLSCALRDRGISCAAAGGAAATLAVPSQTQVDLVAASPIKVEIRTEVFVPPVPPPPPVAVLYVTDRKPNASPPLKPGFFQNARLKPTIQTCATSAGTYLAGNLCYLAYGEVKGDDTDVDLTPANPADGAKALSAQIASDYPGATHVVLFIHGFNHPFASSVEDARVLEKSLTAAAGAQPNTPNVPVIVYSWPTEAADYELPLGLFWYFDDETNNAWTAPHLRDFLAALLDASPALRIDVVAHSMGNRLLLDALIALREETLARSGSLPCAPAPVSGNYCGRIGEVISIEPDVDQETYAEQTAQLSDFVKGVTLYGSTIDRALQGSEALHHHCRAGELNCSDAYFAPALNVIDATNLKSCDPKIHHSYWAPSAIIQADLAQLIVTGTLMTPHTPRAHLSYSATPFPEYVVLPADAKTDCR